jgi:6-phosphogluconolactonase
LAFGPSSTVVYCLNELDSTITVLPVTASGDLMEPTQTVACLPPGTESHGAAIVLSKDGRFLYASHRGPNVITVFAVEPVSGHLNHIQLAETGGSWPRDIVLDPSGNWLLVANKKSHSVLVFGLDSDSGKIGEAVSETRISQPTCIAFARWAGGE